MALRIALAALLVAALIQNLSEATAGGPDVPLALTSLLPHAMRPQLALILISILLALMILPALRQPSRWATFAAAMAAGGLALNAAVQLGASFLTGHVLPGTLAGAVLMLPAALAVLALIGKTALRPALLGAIASPFALLACWHLAALLP